MRTKLAFSLTLLCVSLAYCSSTHDEVKKIEEDSLVTEPKAGMMDSSFYTPPKTFGVVKNLVKDYGANNTDKVDDSKLLQKAIDEISAAKDGGKLIIPEGKYYFLAIQLRSNVQIEIDENATIYPVSLNDGRNHRIFELANGTAKESNIAILGKGKGFTVDLRETANKNIAVFALGNVSNFKISNFNIQDNETIFASILVNFSVFNSQYGWPANGIIEKGRNYNSDIGYGLVQAYAADNVLFRDLYAQGGVALRLETDNLVMKDAGRGGIDNITAKNISSEDGLAAVMFSPHFMKNGKVTVTDVTAKNSAFAVRVEEGFVEIFGDAGESREALIARLEALIGKGCVSTAYKRGNGGTRWAARIKNEFAEITFQKTGLKPGSFETSNVNNVTATYGKTAQLKEAFLAYLNCGERDEVCRPGAIGTEYTGPSIGAVYDNTIDGAAYGSYKVNVQNVKAAGYPSSERSAIKRNTPATNCPAKTWPSCK